MDTPGAVHHRGIVMPWECDDMGHMNIRFYLGRYAQALRHRFAAAPRKAGSPGLPPVRVRDRIVFESEARAGWAVACTLAPAPTGSDPRASEDELLGELVDARTGRRLARFSSAFATRVAPTGVEGPSPSAWTAGDGFSAKPEFVTAVGAFDPASAAERDPAPTIAACASDANALAIGALAAGSDYERDASPIGFVVAELEMHYGRCGDAMPAAYDVRTRLLARSRKALTLGHRVCDPAGGETLAFVRSVCVFFSRESRSAVPIPFPMTP